MTSAVAIVCAKDEASRIEKVLDALVRTIPTMVVDDGSTDGTSLAASRAGAVVTRLPRNLGKGQAMRWGAFLTDPVPVVLFVDADLDGFRPEHVRRMVDPVLSGHYGMVVGVQDYGSLNSVVTELPLISGQRAIRRDILQNVPAEGWEGYGIETFLNHAAAVSGYPVGTTILDGVHALPKWGKVGKNEGVLQMAKMAREVAHAHQRAAHPRSGAAGLGERGAQDPPPVPWHMPPAPFSSHLAIRPARLPPTVSAKDGDVLRELSRHIVDAAAPHVEHRLWTEEAQRRVGAEVGRKLAAPAWAACTVLGYIFLGPAAGTAMSVAGLLSQFGDK